jgi:hypothetical protein
MSRKKRETKITNTRYAGTSGDGEYAVVTVSGKASAGEEHFQRKPCVSCPWRRDAEVGFFPPDAYRHSADTAYDGAMNTFACHVSGTENPKTCAGFLLANADNNMGARLAQMMGKLDMGKVRADGVPLYGSYREMAEANGVPPDDPRLAKCRGNHDG